MTPLPTGTVTFLFTDIEGSTRLLQSLGSGYPELLARHHAIIRAAVAAHGGAEAGTEGDSFFVAFASAAEAVGAAVDVQRALAAETWPADHLVRVRMGLHTGEGALGGDAYIGIDVHRAARIAAAGHGGQVLVSETTRALVASSLPDRVTLADLGEHRLKDLSGAERLHQLVIEGLPAQFPALRTLDATPNNLPTQLTSFLGREREIEEVGKLLEDSRLLTLTGPGGSGKTRLSLQVAARATDRYPDGVFFVPLGLIRDPELVASTIGQALGLPDRGGRAPIERILEHLREKRVLMVLDNFEQVAEAAPVISELLAGADRLSVLVSSRSALHIYGEQEYPVPPLRLPDPKHLPNVESLADYEAVALFVERARAVTPSFAVNAENAAAIAEICVRLDGLPLAIELAAARVRILPPGAILGRLGDRLKLLSGGGSNLPARQQTLRGAIAWSHDMLDPADARLFAGLSVFVGGAGIDEVEAVCGEGIDVLAGLESLVDKSLLRQSAGLDGAARFAMLETILEYAVERAAERGETDGLQRRHADLFAGLVATATPFLLSSDKRQWLDRLELEHDNLRAALSWAIERGDAQTAQRMSAGLWRFWQMRGYLAEGMDRVQAALALPSADHPAARAAAAEAAAGLAYWIGDTLTARRHYEEAIDLYGGLKDPAGEAENLYGLSFTYAIPVGLAESDYAKAQQCAAAALAIFREIGDRAGTGRALWALTNTEFAADDLERGYGHSMEALEIFRAIDDAFMAAWTLYTLGLIHLLQGKPTEARKRLDEALRIFVEAADVTGYVLVLDAYAALAERAGDNERAARLSGGVAALEASSGTGLNPANRKLMDFQPEPLRTDPATAEEWTAGTQMQVPELIAYALEQAPLGSAAEA
ncbi:MAG: adenylate/guanylate cyclase domain-containing protein [Chloroflexota bacterium]